MSKIEPIDEDQDYPDAETIDETAANYKDYKDDGGSIENGNIDDDGDKEAIDSKPILGSLNNIAANVDDDDDDDKTNANVDKKHRNSNDDTCNASANDTNLNETDANDRDDIDSKLGRSLFFKNFQCLLYLFCQKNKTIIKIISWCNTFRLLTKWRHIHLNSTDLSISLQRPPQHQHRTVNTLNFFSQTIALFFKNNLIF